ncbi:DNA repair protein RecO [Alysiella filiformis]|uniref:DNA repair protein RecO n=1 Tax=Alysiella filiformis DSM 16848 TaxID=1120981 RepID=A0A286E1I3_9NEIS|nr:DNA repair protein RecO [Alysiella filiformis]QMT30743.1 DNA repair protein RecO [Alysiella filiformis]UBQ56277.1 DNA repair protein RecO [Alysiella filiformis DSM 16848]SOD64751.1 DNA replication and repair protein RecO [Alysiella filiformis DSM 16848]
MSQTHRINHQPAFVLSSHPWRENSLRVELFSRDYGRVGVLARSARTRGSELRGVLVPFVPISVSWFGKEDWKTLHKAEWLGGWQLAQDKSLFSALYLNELLLKLTAREDPHPDIYHALHQTMREVCTQPEHSLALRQFEYTALKSLGWLPDFERDEWGDAVLPEKWYRVLPEHGLECLPNPIAQDNVVQGELLLHLAQQNLSATHVQAASRLMRKLIAFRVPELQSRLILQQLQQFKNQFSL